MRVRSTVRSISSHRTLDSSEIFRMPSHAFHVHHILFSYILPVTLTTIEEEMRKPNLQKQN